VTVSIRPQAGPPAAAFAVPLALLDEAAAKDANRANLARFVATYAEAAQLDAGATTLPEWKDGADTPGADEGLEVSSPLDRETYEALRRAKPNMLCVKEAFGAGVCYVWSKDHGRAIVILNAHE